MIFGGRRFISTYCNPNPSYPWLCPEWFFAWQVWTFEALSLSSGSEVLQGAYHLSCHCWAYHLPSSCRVANAFTWWKSCLWCLSPLVLMSFVAIPNWPSAVMIRKSGLRWGWTWTSTSPASRSSENSRAPTSLGRCCHLWHRTWPEPQRKSSF